MAVTLKFAAPGSVTVTLVGGVWMLGACGTNALVIDREQRIGEAGRGQQPAANRDAPHQQHANHEARQRVPDQRDAAHRAKLWWDERAKSPAPITVAEALARIAEVKQPSQIRVWINTRHPEILGYEL